MYYFLILTFTVLLQAPVLNPVALARTLILYVLPFFNFLTVKVAFFAV